MSQKATVKSENNSVVPAAVSSLTQPNFTIGAVNDPLEYEADAVAEKVIPKPEKSFIQRCKCDEDQMAQKTKSPIEIPYIQTKIENDSIAGAALSSQINASRGHGIKMDTGTKSFMENRFGNDFSEVNIHTDTQSIQMNRDLKAQAFTVGNDVYFNSGKYSPQSESGKHLLAHELTHVIQQSRENNIIQRQPIPNELNLPCKWGNYIFEDHKIDKVRILIAMDESQRSNLIPEKDIATQMKADNLFISDEAFKVKQCIITPTTTRFAYFKGEPVLLIDPSDASIETIRHEHGHGIFHFLSNNKSHKINKHVTAEDYILELTDIFLQLKTLNITKPGGESLTANWIVDPSEWKPGSANEHPIDVDEFFASAKKAFQSDKKALITTFKKYGNQNKEIAVLGNRLVNLLQGFFQKEKFKSSKIKSGMTEVQEHVDSLSKPSKLEDTIESPSNQLILKLLDPNRKNCKKATIDIK
ncbi:MAG: DUF4157 domain-containing protein [Bacteroidetes bacterium]|nr:DUF4157 domain-containing protein [Bacteroidota bacterium]